MTDRLLVVLEPENHPMDVLQRAQWLAGLYSAELTLLWCDADVMPMGKPFIVSNEARDIGHKILEAQSSIVEELAEPLRAAGLKVATEVLEERPVAEGILHRVDALEPTFVLKGTHYHPSAERSIFVDTDWHLMRICRKPLWLVKPGKMSEKPVVLAAVDPVHSHDKPAALDGAILRQAVGIAGRSGGRVELLHTYDPVTGIGAAATREFKPIRIAVHEIDEQMRKEHRDKLDTLARRHGIDKSHAHQLAGPARELIPGYARQIGANLVVMGALARWGLKRAIIGSTAERVLDQLPCDILIVRKPGAG